MKSFVHLEGVVALDKLMEETFPIDSISLEHLGRTTHYNL